MRFTLKAVLAITMLATVPVVGAQEVTVSGGAAGRFNANPAFTVGQGCATLLLGLQYCGSTFSELTSGGFIAFGGSASPGSNFNNFGSFYLNNNVVANYNGQTFDLELTFTSPTGISGGQAQTFSSIISGNINSDGNGGVFINFDNNPVAFSFTGSNDNPSMSGFGSIMVSDLNVNSGQTASVTGNAQFERISTTVPEPSTYALMAAGLAGLGFMARRRRGSNIFA